MKTLKTSVHITIYSLFITIITSSSSFANVTHYQTHFEKAKWNYSGDQYLCKIEHKVDGFGEFKLVAKPGSQLTVQLTADWLSLQDEHCPLSVQAPSWNQGNTPNSKGTLLKWSGNTGSSHESTNQFLEGLEQGLSWQAKVSDGLGNFYLVETAPIATQNIANQFKRCRQQLLPKPFSYVRRVDIPFESGSSKLVASHDADLNAIAQYVHVDNSIVSVLVDAHADASGEHLANLVLSKERADEVASRLIEFGIDRDKVQVRHHGARSPKVSNNTQAGRQSNRRVTIRLIKSPTKISAAQQAGGSYEPL